MERRKHKCKWDFLFSFVIQPLVFRNRIDYERMGKPLKQNPICQGLPEEKTENQLTEGAENRGRRDVFPSDGKSRVKCQKFL
jgi:hypothetical protein